MITTTEEIVVKGVTYEPLGPEEEGGGYRAKTKRSTGVTYILPVYRASYLAANWSKTLDEKIDVYRKSRRYVLIKCPQLDKAILLAAAFCRYVVNDPSRVSWIDDTVVFEIMDADLIGRIRMDLTYVQLLQRIAGLEDVVGGTPPEFAQGDDVFLLAEHLEAAVRNGIRSRPILYLAITDVLLMYPPADHMVSTWRELYPAGEPTPGAKEFLLWADQHFEIRWCEINAPGGRLGEWQSKRYAAALDLGVEFLTRIHNPKSCFHFEQMAGIDLSNPNWIYVTDELSISDKALIKEHSFEKQVYLCDASNDPEALIRTWHNIAKDLQLPR